MLQTQNFYWCIQTMVLHRLDWYPWTRKLAKWEKPWKKITGKIVRPSTIMKTSTKLMWIKIKSKTCVAFCLNNDLVSYVKSTVYILTLKTLDPAQMRHINRYSTVQPQVQNTRSYTREYLHALASVSCNPSHVAARFTLHCTLCTRMCV